MIRKVFKLIPKELQERIKLFFYNLKTREFTFSVENGHYCTESLEEEWKVYTNTPLYFIVKDVKRYERFHSIKEGEIVMDAGANEGILTLIYSQQVSESGRVISFEPDIKNLRIFSSNLSLNKDNRNIKIEEKGLWNKKDVIDFYEAGTVGSSLFYEGKDSIKRPISVTSIDKYVLENEIQKLDFIKMDIEGAEVEAMYGARETLEKMKPNIAIASYHVIENEYTYKKLELFFTEINYPFRTIFYDDGEIITYAGEC